MGPRGRPVPIGARSCGSICESEREVRVLVRVSIGEQKRVEEAMRENAPTSSRVSPFNRQTNEKQGMQSMEASGDR
jgi:hypothetical protein